MDASLSPTSPPAPESVAEWEDLLVRMEIMPRALRFALEPVPAHDPAAAELLARLVRRERRTAAWLEAVARGADPGLPAEGEEAPGEASALAERFASLRARNFAMLQRRGLEVWAWAGEVPGFGRASVYQVLGWLVEHDVQTLAALRARAGKDADAC